MPWNVHVLSMTRVYETSTPREYLQSLGHGDLHAWEKSDSPHLVRPPGPLIGEAIQFSSAQAGGRNTCCSTQQD